MLEKIDPNKKMSKKECKERMEEMQPKLALLQRQCKELGIPVIIVFEGFGASGKGAMIARLIEPMDPRGFKVFTTERATDEEKERPFMWRFFRRLPARGRFSIFDRSWYTKVLRERMEGITKETELFYAYDEINAFEKLLVDDGTVILKFFLQITKEEQIKRFEHLNSNPSTAWRVTYADWEHNKNYEAYQTMNNEMLEKTDQAYAPWNIIEAMDEEYAACKVYQIVVDRLVRACDEVIINKSEGAKNKLTENEKEKSKGKESGKDGKEKSEVKSVDKVKEEKRKRDEITLDERFLNGVLKGVNLDLDISKEKYKKRINELQARLELLQGEMFLAKIPAVLAFEGWDAAGKGGAIKRLTQKLDPRGYEVIPISAPDETERAHHYLWRFYQHLPQAGHIAIFDRTWYGRVMVERIEGFCTKEEWSRAYSEINHFEEQLANAGTVVIKFWLHIDKKEQEKRFKSRQETPGKEWKITDEDWRNRAKWDEYEKAVDEMIVRTSTTYAPWIVVEANSKMYARVKVLETIVEAFEAKLKQIQ